MHKRSALRSSNGSQFPEPSTTSAFTVTESDLGEFEDIIYSEYKMEAWRTFPSVDQSVMTQVADLSKRGYHWKKAISADLNIALLARKKAPFVESRMRRLLAIAPLVEELGMMDSYSFAEIKKIMNAAFVVHNRFYEEKCVGSIEEWDEMDDTRARGCIMAMAAIFSDEGFKTDVFREEDALWLGNNSSMIIALMPLLKERRFCTKAEIEPLLKSAAPALTEGIL